MKRTGQRGASMVEFAIAAALVLLMLFGIIDFSRLLYTEHAVTHLARTGARWAIVHGSASKSPDTAASVQAYVRGLNTPLMDANSISVATAWPTPAASASPGPAACPAPDPSATPSGTSNANNSRGNAVCVTVTYTFHYLALSKPNKSVTSTSEMVISQ